MGKMGKAGSKVVTEKGIGNRGNLGSGENAGGQIPFMPAASSYPGQKGSGSKSGPSVSTSHTKIPFLPNKPE